ncbi:MAG: hypothetical protein ACQEUT_15840 [Bacillota bacterium]
MKWLILCVCILLLMGGCQSTHNIPIEMAASSSLSPDEESRIPVSPKDSAVSKVKVDEELGRIVGKDYIGKTIYTVAFNGTETVFRGRLVVYIDSDKETVIGKANEILRSAEDL